jgi:hypothetical protein
MCTVMHFAALFSPPPFFTYALSFSPLSLSSLATSLPLPAGIPSQNIGDMLGRVLSGSKHGVRQTRGKFGLGAKMVRVRSTLICHDFDGDDCDDFDEGE